jgi:fumarylpyruvate hydrolase
VLFEPIPPIVAAVMGGDGFPVRRVFCIGQNYAAHAREMGSDPRSDSPFFFTKWAEAVVPSGSVIVYPPATADYQFEGELVVAIGAEGRSIEAKNALNHVFGYAAGLDMTRRDLQAEAKRKGRPWDPGKNVEQSAPLGMIHPVSQCGHLSAGSIGLTQNGEVRQRADLADMIWSIPEVICWVSRFYTLHPGDLIFTGTPSGVGPVATGDRIIVTIAGLTALEVAIGETQ